jgi:hypothetical protein
MTTASGSVATGRFWGQARSARPTRILLGILLCTTFSAQACEEDGVRHAFGLWASMRVVHPLPDAEATPARTETATQPAKPDRSDLRRLDLRSLRAVAPGKESAPEAKPAAPATACMEAATAAKPGACSGAGPTHSPAPQGLTHPLTTGPLVSSHP